MCRFDTVHVRHLPIEEYDLVGLANMGLVHYSFDRFGATGHRIYDESHCLQHSSHDDPGVVVVIHHQSSAAPQFQLTRQYLSVLTADAQLGGEPEGAPMAVLALHAYLAAHQMG